MFLIYFFRYFIKDICFLLLGTFWLSISILISSLYVNKKLFTIFLVIILIIGALGVFSSVNNEQNDFNDTIHKNETLQSVVGSNNIVIFDNDVLYLDFGTYFLKNNSHYLFKNDVGQNIGNLLKNSTIQSKIDNGSKVYYIDCTSKGDNSNYLECVDSSIKLNKIYSPYPKEYIREFDIYEVQTANIS